jgi:hypothetical protein
MSTHEWKPGDVAMVEVGCHANRHRGMYITGGWRYDDDKWVNNDPAIVTARPLVVIDPEDREAVERLMADYLTRYDGMEAKPQPDEVSYMQAALREFAAPTPPKPDEPQGLGAVVEAEGAQWVRFESKTGWWWRDKAGTNRRYADLAVVRILSPGVQP